MASCWVRNQQARERISVASRGSLLPAKPRRDRDYDVVVLSIRLIGGRSAERDGRADPGSAGAQDVAVLLGRLDRSPEGGVSPVTSLKSESQRGHDLPVGGTSMGAGYRWAGNGAGGGTAGGDPVFVAHPGDGADSW